MLANLVQNGETITASATADVDSLDCVPETLNPSTASLSPCFDVVPQPTLSTDSVTGDITALGGIFTLTINGFPGQFGGTGITDFSLPINAAGNLSTSTTATTTSSGVAIVEGGLVPNITGTYQGEVSATSLTGSGVQTQTLMTLFVTENASGTVQAILSCGTCVTDNELTFTGTVIGGGFHGTSSAPGANFTIDVDPVVVDDANAPLGGLAVTLNSASEQFGGSYGLGSGTFTK